MKRIHLIYTLLATSLALTSCDDMDLDPNVENTFGDEYTWQFSDYSQGVLMNAYANIPNRFTSYNNNFLDVATDNAVTNNYGSAIYELATGANLTPHTNPVGNWNTPYDQFRNIHLFLANGLGDNVRYNITDSITDRQIKDRLKGEAYFLRGYWGFQLLQNFGGKTNSGEALGYPIVTRTFTEEEFSDLDNFKRNTYEECVAQIMADLDTAMTYLPRRYFGNDVVTGISGLGRGDDQAAQALKSRVALYAASPAFQPDDITLITSMGRFHVKNEQAYEDKWIRAAEEAQAAMDVMVGNVNGLSANDFNDNNTPAEFIWRNYHNDHVMEEFNYPPLDYGDGFTGPSQNLIDAFPARNGFPITDPRSNYDPADPYAQRDPRLELNVLYNDQSFLGDPLETFVGGKDSDENHYQGTRTGYYLRKWLNIDNMLDPENQTSTHHYHALIRKTELLLNFAEASNEAWGPTAVGPNMNMSALDAIIQIRQNAGINNQIYVKEVASMGQHAFRRLIQNERRIELAFENQRYFDMRRWVLPLDETVQGMEIKKNADGSFNYTKVDVEQRPFQDIKYYYQPIPYNEQVKSDLINNFGW